MSATLLHLDYVFYYILCVYRLVLFNNITIVKLSAHVTHGHMVTWTNDLVTLQDTLLAHHVTHHVMHHVIHHVT